MLGGSSQGFIVPGDGAHPEPGKQNVDGEIGDSLRAKQWLGFRPWGRTKRPVPRPKIVMFRLEDVPERFLQVVVVYVGGEPEFEFVRQGTGGKPVGGEGE